jgi:hypothetical protein
MYFGTALVAYLTAAKAVEPGKCALDHPAMSPEALSRLDAPPRDARDDAAPTQRLSAA